MNIEKIAKMLEHDAFATGHQFSDCAYVFMRAKQECEKEREEWKYKAGTAEQAFREACCLLRECLPFITEGPPGYLNNRVSVWLETADPPNPKITGPAPEVSDV